MTLAFHHFKKDVRQFRIYLVIWFGLLFLDLAVNLGWVGRVEYTPDRGFDHASNTWTTMLPARLVVGLRRLAGLLGRLVHGVQDAEIVLGILEVAFGHHPVPHAGRVAAELEVFLEELLGGAADSQVRPLAVEDVVAIERDIAAAAALEPAATAAPAPAPDTAAVATTITTAPHAFHVHDIVKRFPVRVRRKSQRRKAHARAAGDRRAEAPSS